MLHFGKSFWSFCEQDIVFGALSEQDIVFGAYLTLQAERREDVDVFKKKEQAFISIWS